MSKMQLTREEQAILDGQEGEIKAKILKTLVLYGEIFGAKRLVDITHEGHLVTSFGIGVMKPLHRISHEIADAGIEAKWKFTANPRPLDYENVKCSLLEKLVFSWFIYDRQADYERQLRKIGLLKEDGYTCTCYMKEVGNEPKFGDVLSWAESSAVVYANSVLGARCNRNSAMFDLFGCILGKVPEFGLLLEENRRANWIVEVDTKTLPEPQILGSAIGFVVQEGVPLIKGLDRFLGNSLTEDVKDYLKDMGAALASSGAVGLFHVQNLTPESVTMSNREEELVEENAQTLIIDDAVLEKVYDSYFVHPLFEKATPKLCFIGCPHLSLAQLKTWTVRIQDGLERNKRSKVTMQTVITTSPGVLKEFKKTTEYAVLTKTGATISCICPLMYTSNPLTHKKPIITCSNKLRAYSRAKYFKESEIVDIITGKK
ncbi:MAG: aconitase X [Thermoguttaceae bacterium]